MLSRRTVLRAGGTALASGLAGCSSIPFLSPDVPGIESKQIEAVGSQCVKEGEKQRKASISYNSTHHRLSVSGVTITDSPCTELFINSQKGVGRPEFRDDAYQIIVDILSVGECTPCPAEIEYAGTVEFSHDPSMIYVHHTEEVDGGLRPVGPVASKPIK